MKQGCGQKFSKRYLGRLLLGLVLSTQVLFVCAAGPSIAVLLSGQQTYYQEVSDVFTRVLAAQPGGVNEVHVYGLDQASQIRPGAMVVAIGSRASEFALQHLASADILSLLMPVVAWDELCARHPGPGRRAAVVIDQPLERSLALGQLLVPSAQRVGAVFGPVSVASKPQLRAAVESRGMALISAELAGDDNPIGVLSPLVQKTELFIAVADRAVFNKSVAKWLLYLSFRQKVAVIGFSQSYAKAGALGAVYTSPENIGHHGAELLATVLVPEDEVPTVAEPWRTYYPQYYTLAVNREVARGLNIPVPELAVLYRDYQSALELNQ